MPFKSTTECKEPANQETVWRYMDLPKFINLLQTKSIYFHRSDKFSDPFEGSTPKALVDLRQESYGSSDKYLNIHSKFIEEVRKFTFVSCWHLNEHESAAMWDLYGRSNKGIAIKTTIGGLKSAISDISYPINMSELYYVNFHSELDAIDEKSKKEIRRFLSDKEGPNTIDSILFKRQSFSHERELRLFFPKYTYNTRRKSR